MCETERQTERQTNAEVFWEYSTLVKAFAKAMELIHIFCSAQLYILLKIYTIPKKIPFRVYSTGVHPEKNYQQIYLIYIQIISIVFPKKEYK